MPSAPCWAAWCRCWCVLVREARVAVRALTGLWRVQQEQPSVRLLKHIIRCYLRLSENARARECLRQCFPDQLRDPAFVACLKDDVTTRRWLQQLLVQLGQPEGGPQ